MKTGEITSMKCSFEHVLVNMELQYIMKIAAKKMLKNKTFPENVYLFEMQLRLKQINYCF